MSPQNMDQETHTKDQLRSPPEKAHKGLEKDKEKKQEKDTGCGC